MVINVQLCLLFQLFSNRRIHCSLIVFHLVDMDSIVSRLLKKNQDFRYNFEQIDFKEEKNRSIDKCMVNIIFDTLIGQT